MANYRHHFSTRKTATPQSQPIPGRESRMIFNNAGGVNFKIEDFDHLNRFLFLGTEGGTYYVGEKKLTMDSAKAAVRCIAADGVRVVNHVLEVSTSGRAPKNDPALFVLSMAAGLGDDATRKLALASLPRIARTGTDLYTFVDFVQGFRGWGAGLRRAVGESWYGLSPIEKLALQAVKYRQRNGWSHRDLLRLAHPKSDDPQRRALYEFMSHPDRLRDGVISIAPRVKGVLKEGVDENDPQWQVRLPDVVVKGMQALRSSDNEEIANLVRGYRLPREVLPTESLNSKEVWSALNADMPITATIRNLGKMTSIGLLTRGGEETAKVVRRVKDLENIRRGRVHPIKLLLALKTYAQGHGERGSLKWSPLPEVIDALDEAFYIAMQAVDPSGKKMLVGVDTSSSMNSRVLGAQNLTAYEVAGAMATSILHTEPNAHVIGFNTAPFDVPISKRQRLDDVCAMFRAYSGGTDLASTAKYARTRFKNDGFVYDVLVICTDDETWAGRFHHQEWIEEYRRETNHPVKLVCLSSASHNHSVVDPTDPLSLGIAGFDSAALDLILGFVG